MYNESENIHALLDEVEFFLRSSALPYEIIAVDDGSQDGTADILRDCSGKTQNLVVVTHGKNEGYGAALRSGFAAASGDLIFFMDADRQFDIRELTEFLRHIDRYDFVVGYRKRRRDARIRIVNAKIFNLCARVFLGINARDINCAFKLFRVDMLRSLPLFSSGALVNAEIFAFAKRRGFRFCELPVTHYERSMGKQTGGNVAVVAKAMKNFWLLRRRVRRSQP